MTARNEWNGAGAKKHRRAGRPKLPRGKSRDAIVGLRITVAERAAVERAAKTSGISVSEWIRRALLDALGG
jgi:hypothetical protein